MQLQARLVHAEPGRRVVEVSAHHNGELLGSSLGEGGTAEEAEDRALARLRTRLSLTAPEPAQPAAPGPARPEPPCNASSPQGSSAPPAAPPASRPAPPKRTPAAPAPQQPSEENQTSLELPALPRQAPMPASSESAPERAMAPPQEPAPDPEDWSSELAQIDLELRRLGWQREQESTYLERAFGHPSRSRLTTYGDLVAYLQGLQALEAGCNPADAAVPLRRRDLLSQCDALLAQLQWDAGQGRQFLERQFQVNSRQQLSDTQLLQFNMLLEGELIGSPEFGQTG